MRNREKYEEKNKNRILPTSNWIRDRIYNRYRTQSSRLVNLHTHTEKIEDRKNLNFIICIRLNLCVCVLSVGNYATEKQAFEYKWRPLYCDSDICFRILFRVNCQSFEENAFYECVSCYSKCENGAHSPQHTHKPFNFPLANFSPLNKQIEFNFEHFT